MIKLKWIFLFTISLLLDGILSCYFNYQIGKFSFFQSYFSVGFLTIFLFLKPIKKISTNLILIFLFGFIYDLFYTNFVFLHAFIYLIITLIVFIFFPKIKLNKYNILLINPSITFLYIVILFLLCLIYQIGNISFIGLIYQLLSSILLSIIYGFIAFTLLNKTKRKYLMYKKSFFS